MAKAFMCDKCAALINGEPDRSPIPVMVREQEVAELDTTASELCRACRYTLLQFAETVLTYVKIGPPRSKPEETTPG